MRKSLKSKLLILSTLTLTGLGISINQRIDDVHAAEGDDYALVTDASSLAIGDTIIIAASVSNYALSTTQNNNNRGVVEISRSAEGTISYVSGLQDIVLEAGTIEGTYALNVSDRYLCTNSSSSNRLRSQSTITDIASWTISIADTGVASIIASGSYTRNDIRYNPNGGNPDLFACYASTSSMEAVSVFKKKNEGGETTSPISEKQTVASLGFTYSVEQEVYSFSNVRIRFKSSLEEETYNTLNITGAGVEITAEGYSDVMDIDCSSSIGTETIDGVSYRYIIGTISNIPTTEFTTALTAKGYFIVDGVKVYLQECTYSVASIANRTLEETLTTEQEDALLAFMTEYNFN